MNPNSIQEIKKHIGGTAQNAANLEIAEHEGAMWASNRYWVTPAVRVAPLLEKFNLNPAVPGSYEVNGSVRPSSLPVDFRPGAHLDPALYTVALVPALMAGKQVYTRADSGVFRAVYQTTDGAYLGLAADDLEWLSSTWSVETAEDCYHSRVRYLAAEPGKGARVVAVVADLTRRLSPVVHGTGADGEPTRSGGETENLGPRVLGIIAAVVLEAGQ